MAVLLRDKNKCTYCGKLATSVDHVVPVSRGGTNDPANVVAACRSCNSISGVRVFGSVEEKREFLKRYPRRSIPRMLGFSQKLEAYRRLKRLTIRDLSSQCGIAEGTMVRCLWGKNAPTAENLVRIMKRLDVRFEPEDFEEDGAP